MTQMSKNELGYHLSFGCQPYIPLKRVLNLDGGV